MISKEILYNSMLLGSNTDVVLSAHAHTRRRGLRFGISDNVYDCKSTIYIQISGAAAAFVTKYGTFCMPALQRLIVMDAFHCENLAPLQACHASDTDQTMY